MGKLQYRERLMRIYQLRYLDRDMPAPLTLLAALAAEGIIL